MVLEVAVLNVKPSMTQSFETDFARAEKIISAADGYLNHTLKRCIEQPNQYLLLVNWATLESHTEGFRGSEAYQTWKALLHHYYDPFPTVEHYEALNIEALNIEALNIEELDMKI